MIHRVVADLADGAGKKALLAYAVALAAARPLTVQELSSACTHFLAAQFAIKVGLWEGVAARHQVARGQAHRATCVLSPDHTHSHLCGPHPSLPHLPQDDWSVLDVVPLLQDAGLLEQLECAAGEAHISFRAVPLEPALAALQVTPSPQPPPFTHAPICPPQISVVCGCPPMSST